MASQSADATKASMFAPVHDKTDKPPSHSKVTVVGVGQVGMACAYSIMCQNLVGELALVDVLADKLQGEGMDLLHGTAFVRRCVVRASTDYAVTANSKIVVITAGARQREGESRLSLVQRNVDIFSGIVPQITKHSPNAIIIVVSNPVDVMAYVTWKLSGFPLHRVIGSGTMLDSGRFRVLLSEKLGISPSSCHAYIVGEHGDSSVPVWSAVTVGGVALREHNPKCGLSDDPDHFAEVHKQVVNSAYEIIKLKGYTSWAIGLAVSTLCKAMLNDERSIHPISTIVKGVEGLESERVFLSMPCILGAEGVADVVRLKLDSRELAQLQHSLTTIDAVIKDIKWPDKK